MIEPASKLISQKISFPKCVFSHQFFVLKQITYLLVWLLKFEFSQSYSKVNIHIQPLFSGLVSKEMILKVFRYFKTVVSVFIDTN